MKITLTKVEVNNRMSIQFEGEFTAEDLEAGFPFVAPHNADNDALFKDLTSDFLQVDADFDDAARADVIARAAKAIKVGHEAVALNGEVIGPAAQ